MPLLEMVVDDGQWESAESIAMLQIDWFNKLAFIIWKEMEKSRVSSSESSSSDDNPMMQRLNKKSKKSRKLKTASQISKRVSECRQKAPSN